VARNSLELDISAQGARCQGLTMVLPPILLPTPDNTAHQRPLTLVMEGPRFLRHLLGVDQVHLLALLLCPLVSRVLILVLLISRGS